MQDKSYLFQGVILPERAQLTLDFELQFVAVTSNETATAKINIILNQVVVWIESDFDWNIFDLRNIVKNIVQIHLNFVAYLKGYAYDLEITRVINKERSIDYVFGVGIECIEHRGKDIDLNKEISILKEKCAGQDGIYINRCLNDLVFSMKHADDTAFYCYRAIESLKHHCISILQLYDLNQNKQWEKFREKANIEKDDIMFIKEKADPLRHGNFTGVTGEERAQLFTKTWDIVDKYLKSV